MGATSGGWFFLGATSGGWFFLGATSRGCSFTRKSEGCLTAPPIVAPRPSSRGSAVGGVLAGGFPLCCFPPLVWCFPLWLCGGGAPLWFFCRALQLAFMTSYAAPSGGSASDDWTKPGRTRSKARSIARADDPADSALRQPTSHDPRPTARPTTNDRRPTTSSTIDDRRPRPTTHDPDPRLTTHVRRPTTHDQTTTTTSTTTTTQGPRPTTHDPRPTTTITITTTHNTRPTTHDQRPTTDDSRPTTDDRLRPTTHNARPTSGLNNALLQLLC